MILSCDTILSRSVSLYFHWGIDALAKMDVFVDAPAAKPLHIAIDEER